MLLWVLSLSPIVMSIRKSYNNLIGHFYMKHHFFLQASQRGIIDIDKKIPFIKTLFPDSKIEKKL